MTPVLQANTVGTARQASCRGISLVRQGHAYVMRPLRVHTNFGSRLGMGSVHPQVRLPAPLQATPSTLTAPSQTASNGNGVGSTAVKTWQVRIFSHTPFNRELKSGMLVSIVDDNSDFVAGPFVVDEKWSVSRWIRPRQALSGRVRSSSIALPADVVPGALIVEVKDGRTDVFLSKVEITGDTVVTFPAHTYIQAGAGPRSLFGGPGKLPAETPPHLAKLRAADLDAQKFNSPGLPPANSREYGYDVYNDLALGISPKDKRSPLGGKEFPYPRRNRTGRPKLADGITESRVGGLGVGWLPKDETFDTEKNVGFKGGAIVSALPLAWDQLKGNLLGRLFGKAPSKSFESVEDAKRLYADNGETDTIEDDVVVSSVKVERKEVDELLHYDVPYVLAGREDVWRSDVEFGRQYVAGQNPLMITALKGSLPAGTTITAAHIQPFLDAGVTVQDALNAPTPKLFWGNYWAVFEDFLPIVSAEYPTGRELHAARVILYKRNDGFLVPVAIEMKNNTTLKEPHVFTPTSPPAVWALVKTVAGSLDSAVHQVGSHWLRTHACIEPFIIALRRNISPWHPVFRLMLPHFRYTLSINANARGILISGNNIVESVTTPGRFTMEMSSKIYGALWAFKEQGLPGDLKARGIMNEQGELLLDDYPYAEDGLLIWNEVTKYFTEYLKLYYKDDIAVQNDTELHAWWKEAREVGHADAKPGGWIEITGIDSLVEVLATIAWVSSAHHAAVNFGQYDYSGFMPNRPSFTTKPVPAPGTPAYEALASKVPGTNDFDKEVFSYLSGPLMATTLYLIVNLLSQHASEEQYLSSPDQEWLVDPVSKAVNAKFTAAISATEAIINARNSSDTNKSRDRDSLGLPYRLLLASSPPGRTGRGIPYSISI